MTGFVCSRLSDVDPQHCLAAVYAADAPLPRGTAEDAVLSWLITLPDGIDPAHAAAAIGRLPDVPNAIDGEAARLTALLKQIAAYPATRLPPSRRRRLSS